MATTELLAGLLIVVVHIIGAGVLLRGLIDFDDPDRGSWRDWWPRDDRGDGGGGDDPEPTAPEPERGGGLAFPVLPESRPVRGDRGEPSRRLTPPPARRPAHAPERTPAPEREPT